MPRGQLKADHGFTVLHSRDVQRFDQQRGTRHSVRRDGRVSGAAGLFSDMGGETWLDTEMLVAGTRPVLAVVVEKLSLNFQTLLPPNWPQTPR